jgi:2,4-dienoyl-CoA reductase-like NADH-dependent reductase (Old Yellow Enzyme family)
MWSKEQVAGRKGVTAGVHNAGGRIVLQLWHGGRVSDPIYLNGVRAIKMGRRQGATRPQRFA